MSQPAMPLSPAVTPLSQLAMPPTSPGDNSELPRGQLSLIPRLIGPTDPSIRNHVIAGVPVRGVQDLPKNGLDFDDREPAVPVAALGDVFEHLAREVPVTTRCPEWLHGGAVRPDEVALAHTPVEPGVAPAQEGYSFPGRIGRLDQGGDYRGGNG